MPKVGVPVAYYNDNDPFVCQWLRNLIRAGQLPYGRVDCRPIQEVTSNDVRGHQQQHYFAGIGGWPLALSLAGWGGRPVWTASLPCQPFSVAGKGRGVEDERHLWPYFRRLVRECRPECLLGEQVGGEAGYEWLSGIRSDLEEDGYAVGAADLPAASVNSPNVGQRLYWVATTLRKRDAHEGSQEIAGEEEGVSGAAREREWVRPDPWQCGIPSPGHDGRRRRLPPGIELLADGVPSRVEQIRAYGNSVCPQLAAVFIRSFMDVLEGWGVD
jgi:DNA (cytosine-5)-methyltransferase 1